MKVFADTANLDQVIRLHRSGLISGVTTNPSLVAKEPKSDFNQMIGKLADFCGSSNLPLSVEVFSTDPSMMIEEGKNLSLSLASRAEVAIKVPVLKEYASVIHELSSCDINVNATCCYTAEQMILAASSGARYVSLFYRRAIDSGEDVKRHLRVTRKFIEENGLNCEIIAGSIRQSCDIGDAFEAGAHIVTASPKIIEDSLYHKGSADSVAGFEKDFSEWIKR